MAEAVQERKSIIDEYIPAPEGSSPEMLHVVFDKKTRDYADQYHTALRVSRGLPFLPEEISITDPLVLVLINIYRLTDSNRALKTARQYYDKWNKDAKMHSYMMAMLSDNNFFGDPTEWDTTVDTPPGVPVIPEPKYDLNNPVERRLKQIIDFLNRDDTFQFTVMQRINDAMVNLVNEVEKDPVTGFQSGTTDTNLHGAPSTENADVGSKSDNGSATQGNILSVGTMADGSDQPVKRKRREVEKV